MDRQFRDFTPSSQTTRPTRRPHASNTILESSEITYAGTQALNQLRHLAPLTQVPAQRCHVPDTDFPQIAQSLHTLRQIPKQLRGFPLWFTEELRDLQIWTQILYIAQRRHSVIQTTNNSDHTSWTQTPNSLETSCPRLTSPNSSESSLSTDLQMIQKYHTLNSDP